MQVPVASTFVHSSLKYMKSYGFGLGSRQFHQYNCSCSLVCSWLVNSWRQWIWIFIFVNLNYAYTELMTWAGGGATEISPGLCFILQLITILALPDANESLLMWWRNTNEYLITIRNVLQSKLFFVVHTSISDVEQPKSFTEVNIFTVFMSVPVCCVVYSCHCVYVYRSVLPPLKGPHKG